MRWERRRTLKRSSICTQRFTRSCTKHTTASAVLTCGNQLITPSCEYVAIDHRTSFAKLSGTRV